MCEDLNVHLSVTETGVKSQNRPQPVNTADNSGVTFHNLLQPVIIIMFKRILFPAQTGIADVRRASGLLKHLSDSGFAQNNLDLALKYTLHKEV